MTVTNSVFLRYSSSINDAAKGVSYLRLRCFTSSLLGNRCVSQKTETKQVRKAQVMKCRSEIWLFLVLIINVFERKLLGDGMWKVAVYLWIGQKPGDWKFQQKVLKLFHLFGGAISDNMKNRAGHSRRENNHFIIHTAIVPLFSLLIPWFFSCSTKDLEAVAFLSCSKVKEREWSMVYTWARGYHNSGSPVTKQRPPQKGEIQRGQGDLCIHLLFPLQPHPLCQEKKTPEHNLVKHWMLKTWGFHKNIFFQNNMETHYFSGYVMVSSTQNYYIWQLSQIFLDFKKIRRINQIFR